MSEFDYVVVGGGAAGAVVARRLVDSGASVLLLEAGKSDRHPYVRVPAGFFRVLKSGHSSWGYKIEPQAGLGGRSFDYPRGKVLGGSGAINGLVQSWGLPYDYDRWARDGCEGWSFEDVRPFFMRSESYASGDPTKRGRDGPIVVSDYADLHPVARDFLRAAAETGLPVLADYNSDYRAGVSQAQQTRNGRFRETTATAYLRPVMGRSNLAIKTSALVCSIDLDASRCARGVTYRVDGVEQTATARREVIVCGGTVNTPHLLNLSGIGHGEQLQSAGIAVRHHLPGVGHGMQDHYTSKLVRRLRGMTTLNEQGRGLRLMAEVCNYMVRGKGILTASPSFVTGYLKSSPELDIPDLQISFIPASFELGGKFVLESKPGMSMGVWQMRPESRGHIRTISPRPEVAPIISPGYLQSAVDQKCVVAGLRWARRLLFAKAFAAYGAEEVMPGAEMTTDEQLLDYARRAGGTTYHPVGSCRMGTDDLAVVDRELRVRGVRGLRIADASVMPYVTSGNTHAPTVMIAEKAADLILRKLPA
ncbi:GMC family oxidoreductase [Variovorax sp. Sphag1AA]|uniref:GMC family oxidoreductase n=1 Tax=Variovorax sp. Sphag1AA TaxID=2587027 RepID=UPI00160C8489|nr:GMC family oxidoreductase N-terminal domain-containing protein [Variovorax sp. Sphag1AA]